MIGTILCMAATALGVQYGWEPSDAGGLEYIVQIDRESLKNLEKGIPLRSDFPRNLQGLQTIRFQVGDKKPPCIALSLPILPTPTQPIELANNPGGKPLLVKKADFEEPNNAGDSPKNDAAKENSTSLDPQKPWALLYAALCAAVGLAAAFCYLLWLHVDMRARYRLLLGVQQGVVRIPPADAN
jgi:hypothetical protein